MRSTPGWAVAAAAPADWLTTWWVAAGVVLGVWAIIRVGRRVEKHLERPIDLATHPFVRFPWWIAVSAALFAYLRDDPPVWYVGIAYGSVYLGAHAVHYVRVRCRPISTPPLPCEYVLSPLPAAGVLSWAVTSGCLCWTGYSEYVDLTWLTLVRNLQAAYGGYYLGCCLVYHRHRWTNFSGWVPYLGVFGLIWKDVGAAGRAGMVTAATAGLGAAAAGAATFKMHARDCEIKEKELDHKVSKFNQEVNKFNHEVTKYADAREERLIDKKINYSRQGDQVSIIRSFSEPPPSPGVLLNPRRSLLVKPTRLTVSDKDPPGSLYSPYEKTYLPEGLVNFVCHPGRASGWAFFQEVNTAWFEYPLLWVLLVVVFFPVGWFFFRVGARLVRCCITLAVYLVDPPRKNGTRLFYRAGLISGWVTAVPAGLTDWLNKTVTWLAAVEPTVWVAVAVGFFPFGVLLARSRFEARVKQEIKLESHPFVRFPAAVVAGAFLGGWRAGEPGWYVLLACGTVYLGSHLFDRVRRRRGLPIPVLPLEYELVSWPATAVFVWTFFSGCLYSLGYLDETHATPWALVRNLQAAYGGYYLVCYAVYRQYGWTTIPVVWAGFPGVTAVHTAWKDLGEAGRAAVAASAGVTTAFMKFRHKKRELVFEQSKVDLEQSKLFYKGKKLDLKLEQLRLVGNDRLDQIQQKYDLKGHSYNRVNHRFENVQKSGFGNSPPGRPNRLFHRPRRPTKKEKRIVR